MSGLFRRNRPPRAATAEEPAAEPAPDFEPVAASEPVPPPEDGEPVVEQIRDLPAGVDPDEILADPPTSRRRSRLRKRARLLHKMRELLLRDLGGLVHEIHRVTATTGDPATHENLVRIKLERIDRVEAELHDLHALLQQPPGPVVLREPGVGGSCPGCGELYGSDARFCWSCGIPLTKGAQRRLEAAESGAGTGDVGTDRADGAEGAARSGDAAAGHGSVAADAPRPDGLDGAASAEPDADGAQDDRADPPAAQEPVRSGERRA